MTSPRKTTEALAVTRFLLPKHGNEMSECEDAIGVNETRYRFVVADGATEAFDAGNWSRRLAQNWVDRDGLLTATEFWQWLISQGEALTESWKGQQLSWYSEAKQRIGSFAAFVGVEIDFDGSSPHWTAIALGDSCLIHARGDELIDSFPISNSTLFGSSPILAPSAAATNSHASNEIAVTSGRLDPGDQVFLMSDAIASWYLMLTEQGDSATKSQFCELLGDPNQQRLEEFLELQRTSGRLKNDDIAIIRLTLQGNQ